MDPRFMKEAVKLSFQGMRTNFGGPFGAVVVRDGRIIGMGFNRVLKDCDPTAHAEVVAIRAACDRIGSFDLSGCDLYASGEPCPMCYAAASAAHIRHIYYANTREELVAAGFKDGAMHDAVLSREAGVPPDSPARIPTDRLEAPQAAQALDEWIAKPDKVAY